MKTICGLLVLATQGGVLTEPYDLRIFSFLGLIWGFPKIRAAILLGVPIIKTRVFWVYTGVPLF